MPGFQTPVDIANRGLQHCGVELIDNADGFNENSDRAQQTSFCYDKLRRAELRRNGWRFAIKYAVIRPINFDITVRPTMLISPTLWDSTATYFVGSIVMDAMGSYWISSAPDNVNNAPGNSTTWDLYYGPVGIPSWDSTTTYFAGDVVYVASGLGTFITYMSRIGGNASTPGTVDAYSATAIYMADALVSSAAVTYQSLVDVNVGNTPSAANAPAVWASITTYAAAALVRGSDGYVYTSVASGNVGHDPVLDNGTYWTRGALALWTTALTRTASADSWLVLSVVLQQLPLTTPIGMGPGITGRARSVYRLPANFLRLVPQDPKAGSVSYLGAPSGLSYLDWDLAGQYLVTRTQTPIVLRFIADVTNVREMDDMFCEGLGARIGYEVCPKLTQSVSKRTDIAAAYKTFMSDAREVNAIEVGAVEPPEDEYITCRA